jgi:hypothetical protein
VAKICFDISEEHNASTFRVTEAKRNRTEGMDELHGKAEEIVISVKEDEIWLAPPVALVVKIPSAFLCN